MNKTASRIDAPTVFLVALDERLGGLCFAIFDDATIRIIAIRTIAAACDRIAMLLPSLVVVPAELSSDEKRMLDDHAGAAGSEVVSLAEDVTDESARSELCAALERARAKRTAQSEGT